MTGNERQAVTQPAGFWKIRHAVIGLGALLLVIVFVRSCGDDAEEQQREAESGKAIPRTSVAVEIPAPEWQQYPPVQQQARQALGQPQQQQPVYGYPGQQPQPAYGYPTQPQQPVYGYPGQQQQQPVYGYPAQQQQPVYGYPDQPQQQPSTYGYPTQQAPQQRLPATDPGNPWAVQQQPAYGYGTQQGVRPQQWGETPRQPQVYIQPPGSSQYRPLDEKPHTGQKRSAAPATATTWPTAPYDRLSGSSFGSDASAYPYGGAYPGYQGGLPYGGVPTYGGGWPGGGLGYPGGGWPGFW